MLGEVALDTSIAIQFLNGNSNIVTQVANLPAVILPLIVVGELLFGAENSSRRLKNLTRYLQFINSCTVVSLSKETATIYARIRLDLKLKGRPIPENDIWIAAQCLENNWELASNDGHFTYVNGLVVKDW